MDYRDTLRSMDFTTRHEPFIKDLHHGVRDALCLFRFVPSVLHDLSGTWEQQDRSAERDCMALPSVQVPNDLPPTQHIHLRTMWLQDIDLCSWSYDNIMVKYTGLDSILAHQGHLPLTLSPIRHLFQDLRGKDSRPMWIHTESAFASRDNF